MDTTPVRVPVTISVTEETKRRFKALCAMEGIALSRKLEKFMEEELSRSGDLSTAVASPHH
jgi:hypothetical protein